MRQPRNACRELCAHAKCPSLNQEDVYVYDSGSDGPTSVVACGRLDPPLKIRTGPQRHMCRRDAAETNPERPDDTSHSGERSRTMPFAPGNLLRLMLKTRRLRPKLEQRPICKTVRQQSQCYYHLGGAQNSRDNWSTNDRSPTTSLPISITAESGAELGSKTQKRAKTTGSKIPFTPQRRNMLSARTRRTSRARQTNNIACFGAVVCKIHRYYYADSENIVTDGPTVRDRSRPCPYPVYAPYLPAISVDRIDIPEVQWLHNVVLYESICRRVKPRVSKGLHTNLTQDEIALLLQNGYLKKATRSRPPIAYVNIWKHAEDAKKRGRLIVHPALLNRNIRPEQTSCKFPTGAYIRARVKKFPVLLEFDMKAYFYQFHLSEDVSRFFGIKHGSEYFQFRLLPMGFAPAPRVAQAVSSWLVKDALGPPHSRMDWAVMVDNVYIFCHPEDARQIYDRFCAAASSINATIGKAQVSNNSAMILGVLYNLQDKTAQIPASYLLKHSATLRDALHTTVDTFLLWRCCAILIWAIIAKNISLGRHYELLKLMSSMGRAVPRSPIGVPLWSKLQTWEMSQQQLFRLALAMKDVFYGPPTHIYINPATHDALVYCDAATGTRKDATAGIAAVAVTARGVITVWAQKAPKHLTINALEMRALRFATKAARSIQLRRPLFLSDSLVVVSQTKRGYAPDRWVNADLQAASKMYVPLTVEWVCTDENLADGPSRNVINPSGNPTSRL